MDIHRLEKLARKMVGRFVKINVGEGAFTDGATIMLPDFQAQFSGLPMSAVSDMEEFVAGHEAGHIVEFDKLARKIGKPFVSAEEFYQMFADPLSPGADSRDYVRHLMNIVEDQLVDLHSARAVGQDKMNRVNRYFVWNRQGGRRPSLAEYESKGSEGKCAAFVEALFQLAIYGELIESFFSSRLETSAKEAAKAMASFGQGSLSRTQALQKVLDALYKYCPPPWKLPEQYQPPRGERSQGGNPSSSSGDGQGKEGQGGESEGEAGDGQSGDSGQGNPGKGNGDSDSKPGKGQGEGDSSSDSSPDAEGEKSESESESSSESSGEGTPSESESRGSGTGETAGDPKDVSSAPKPCFEDNNLEALLRMLERVIAERTKASGRGMPRWRQWAPGDTVSSPDEICRYQEDDTFGVDPLKRRCTRQRTRDEHLIAVFIDSSGSVEDSLFSQLYRVFSEVAEKIAQTLGIKLGVGQFSGGAAWVLEPTDDAMEIQALAQQIPQRIFDGSTVVGEIYKILVNDFAGYETADLIVLTDGYVEDGKELAQSLETFHENEACELKLHGVVFRGKGKLKQFNIAKDQMPQFVRTWHLGDKE